MTPTLSMPCTDCGVKERQPCERSCKPTPRRKVKK